MLNVDDGGALGWAPPAANFLDLGSRFGVGLGQCLPMAVAVKIARHSRAA